MHLDLTTEIKLAYPSGTRISVVTCCDPYARLPKGLCGTVSDVDDARTIHVQWDDGRTLGVCLMDGDEIKLV